MCIIQYWRNRRERCRLERLPRYSPTTTEFFGKPFALVDACTFRVGVNEIFGAGIYEFQTNNPKPRILDCGANIGLSVVYFKKLHRGAKIVAFEPDPAIFQALKKNVSTFGLEDVELHQAAVWTENGSVEFKPEGGFSGRILPGTEGTVVVPCARWLGGYAGRNESSSSAPPRQVPVVADDEGEWLILEGGVWFKYLDALNSISGIIRQAGSFETTELDLVRWNLPEGGTFIDVGANAGLYSLLAWHWFKDVQIHAFEPVPFAYDAFRANIAKNRIGGDRLFLNQMAVGDENKTVHITTDFHSSNYLADSQSSEKTVPVSCVTLDHYAQEQKIGRVDFIKIDVEGKEFAVLAGAEQMLRRDRPKLLVELLEKPAPFHDRIVDDYRKSLRLMLDLGYEYYVIDDDNHVLHMARLQEGKFNGSFHNYLFYHKDGGAPSIAAAAAGGR